MTFFNYVYPVIAFTFIFGLVFVPALVVIGFIPKRFPAARHAVLAITFAGLLGYVAVEAVLQSSLVRDHVTVSSTPRAVTRAEAAPTGESR